MQTATQLIMLGTGNALCTRCYNTCFYLRTPQGGLLVDGGGGNGIFRQLRRAGIAIDEVRHVFLTHCHTDHILGVVWLIRRISPMIHKGRYPVPLTIYCHSEAAEALRTMCRLMMSAKIAGALDQSIILREVADGEEFAVAGMRVTVHDIHSTKQRQIAFSAVLPDGQRLACLGDEAYNPVCESWVRGADWLLSEAFCLWSDRQRFNPYEKSHSTARDAGTVAQQLEVSHLVLYHTEDTRLQNRRLAYTADAAQCFTGDIYVPDDLETIALSRTRRLAAVAALDENGAIGYKGQLLCHLPADLRHFKELTLGHSIIMGRHTYDSLPTGALPGRQNIVVTRDTQFHADGVEVTHTIEAAIAASTMPGEVMIIGGAQLYTSTIGLVDTLYLTRIHATFESADAHFPAIDPDEWSEVSSEYHAPDERNTLPYTFITLKRQHRP